MHSNVGTSRILDGACVSVLDEFYLFSSLWLIENKVMVEFRRECNIMHAAQIGQVRSCQVFCLVLFLGFFLKRIQIESTRARGHWQEGG